MKKYFVFLFVIVFLLVGVIAESTDADKINNVLEKRGINPDDSNVSEVDFNNPPPEIDVSNVKDTKIKVYKVSPKKNKSFYMITSSGVKQSVSQTSYYRTYLNFGTNEVLNSSGFLKNSLGIVGDVNKGYVMTREGSITGISTNLEIEEGKGKIEILIYKNEELIGFRNSFDVSSSGLKNDYDLQSNGVVKFNAGDVISVYVKSSEGIVYSDVTTLVELTQE